LWSIEDTRDGSLDTVSHGRFHDGGYLMGEGLDDGGDVHFGHWDSCVLLPAMVGPVGEIGNQIEDGQVRGLASAHIACPDTATSNPMDTRQLPRENVV
jgi:hypothetical protein